MLDVNSYVAKSLDLSCRTIQGSAYILLETEHRLLQLNGSGSFIWDSINGQRRIEDIVERCIQRFGDDHSTTLQLVHGFVHELVRQGYVQVSPFPFTGVMTYG